MDTTRYLQVLAASVSTLVIITGVGTAIGAANLDRATARQCASSDWPKAANDLHRDWCVSNGYAVSRISRY
jgi:hypothetical protein